MSIYRPNVACILINSAAEILICERAGFPGSWQFPQGGVKKGESLINALYREVEEELGLKRESYRILSSRGPYCYLFPRGIKKEGFAGQKQNYYLAMLTNPDAPISFGVSPEFAAARWIPPAAYDLSWVAPMKRGVYATVFAEFFGVFPKAAKSPGILLT